MRLDAFKEAFARPGPALSACLDVSKDDEAGQRELELRWEALREDLTESGAPAAALDRVGQLLTQDTGLGGGWGRVVVATADHVLVDRVFQGRPRAHGRWDELPHLMPLVNHISANVSHLLVVADRTGADISVSARGGSWSETVEGDDNHIRKVHAGGWSELRYQHTVENVWEANAADVAARVDRLVTEAAVEIVAVAGDVRATQLLSDSVSTRTRELLHVLDGGGRNAGADEGSIREQLTALREHIALQRARQHVDTFLEEHGRAGRAASGLAATVDALRRGQVDVLLVPQGWDDHERAYFGPEAALLGLKSDDLVALGVREPRQAPVSDVVVRAAAGTDAELVVVPGHLLAMDGEPAAILRFADQSTMHDNDGRTDR
jgi:hypothetical protein